MPTTYTSLIGLALPTTGELTGTWGTTVNDYITRYLDAAVAGTQTLSTDADVTLTVTNGSNLGATSAQYAILNCTGARTVQRTITVPAASKSYLVINGTTGGQSVKVVGAGPTTGVTLANGERALIAWNGSDFVKAGSNFVAAGADTQVQYNSSGALAGSANLTFNGTTLTANALTVSTGNLSFSGTAQRITADMSNATVANRLMFQTNTVNGATGLGILPNGTGNRSTVSVFGGSDTANSAICTFEITTGATAGFNSAKFGTGTTLPIAFSIDSTVQLQLNTNGTITSVDNAAAVGYKGTPLNERSANYTLVLADQGLSITHPASDNNPRTFTIPANGAVAYPVGTTITFINMINTVTIAITTDTMYLAGSGSTGSRTLAAYGMATAVKMTSTTWIISGNGLT